MAKKDPYRMQAKEVLKREVVTISADDTLQTALELMADNRLTALPVLDHQGGCEGILSAADIVEAARDITDELHDLGRVDEVSYQWLRDSLAEHDLARHTVGEFMTRNVATVVPEATLPAVAHEMVQHRVHRLPVVDKKGKLLGIISTMDVLAAFVEGAPA
jgi:CBS domain-containing protein